MAEKKAKLPRITTPRGVAVYPWLSKADTQFDTDGVFKTSLRLDPNGDAVTSLLNGIMNVAKEHKAELKLTPAKLKVYHMPFENEVDDDGDETGMVILKFKTKATLPDGKAKNLTMFDGGGEKFTGGSVWGGSEIKVNFSPAGYQKGKNVGVCLYLNAVQVLKLVTGGGGDATDYGFGEDAEGYHNAVVAETADGDDPDF